MCWLLLFFADLRTSSLKVYLLRDRLCYGFEFNLFMFRLKAWIHWIAGSIPPLVLYLQFGLIWAPKESFNYLVFSLSYIIFLPFPQKKVDNGARVDASKEENKRIHKDKGVYLGGENDIQEDDHESTAEDDGLSDIWKQMNIALEYSKVLLCLSTSAICCCCFRCCFIVTMLISCGSLFPWIMLSDNASIYHKMVLCNLVTCLFIGVFWLFGLSYNAKSCK